MLFRRLPTAQRFSATSFLRSRRKIPSAESRNGDRSMFPLDAIYGPLTYRRFDQDKMFKAGLKSTLQSSREVDADRPLAAGTYTELVDIVSFLSIMNKRHTLYFRGQASNWPLRPTAFRPIWTSLNGTRHHSQRSSCAARDMGPSKRSDIIDRPVGLRRAADAAPSHVGNVQRGCVGCRSITNYGPLL
jgi:hypothetical protein